MDAETALHLTTPAGAAIGFGFLDVRGRVQGRYRAVNPQGKFIWERTIDAGFAEIPATLAAMARELVKAALGVDASPALDGSILPSDPAALRALMLGLDAASSVEMDVSIPDPAAAFEPLLRCAELDPARGLAAEFLLSMALTWASKRCLPAPPAVTALGLLRGMRPDLVKVDAVLSEVCLTWGDGEGAVEAATRYLRRCGSEPAILAYAEELVGRACDLTGERARAAAAFARAVKHDSGRIFSWRSLAHLAAQSGRLDEAEVCLVQAERVDRDNAEVQEALRCVRGELLRLREQRGPLQPPDSRKP
jgi:tetratricopeptide (TPR) repeat protein